MPSYIVAPVTKRLTLPCGEWVAVKAQLNHGEYQDVMERCYRPAPDGTMQRVPFRYNEVMMSAYLVDWSFVGLDDQPIVIRGLPPDDIEAAFRKFEQRIYREIRDAVDAHVAEVSRVDDEKKSAPSGASASSTTSVSPDVATGVMSGSGS